MKRYDVARHAKKGATKRWSTNFQLPAVKKARKERSSSVKAVIVILASSHTGLHFPHQRAWYDWSVKSKEVGFAVYLEDQTSFERDCSQEQWAFWRPFLCPLQSSSAWGQFSLVYSELLALKWARDQFVNAAWFFVVSGDSVPAKSTRSFVQGPLSGKSVLGFTGFVELSVGGRDLYEHSQWKVLSINHVNLLVDDLVQSRETLREWKALVLEEKRRLCCASVPDEWLIGTFIITRDQKAKVTKGKSIMVQRFVEGFQMCCRKPVSHAKCLKDAELRQLYQEAWDDPSAFAVRKVDTKSSFAILEKNV
jgi:hypothetical protein